MATHNLKSVATLAGSAIKMPGTPIGEALGLKSMETSLLMQVAQSGLRWNAVRKFLDFTGLSHQDLAKYLNIPKRTLARRREAGAFDRRESELLLRLAEIFQAALGLFDAIPMPREYGSLRRSVASATHALSTLPKASSVIVKCAT